MEVLRVAHVAFAASGSVGSRPLHGAPHRLPPGAWRGAGVPSSPNRRRWVLSMACCTAEKRKEALPPAFEENASLEVLPTEEPVGNEQPEVLAVEERNGKPCSWFGLGMIGCEFGCRCRCRKGMVWERIVISSRFRSKPNKEYK